MIKERKGRIVNKMFKILTFFSFCNFFPLSYVSFTQHTQHCCIHYLGKECYHIKQKKMALHFKSLDSDGTQDINTKLGEKT